MKTPLFIARQGRCPSGWFGHIVAHVMASETAAENESTLAHLALAEDDDVLEIGFGHGRTLALAARQVSHGRLAGIDASPLMHRLAMRRNRRLVAAGRLRLELGDSQRLPFASASFDKVYAVHTLYFWQDLTNHLDEILRVLRPGGRLVLGFRPAEDAAAVARFPDTIYKFRPAAEVARSVSAQGFANVETLKARIGARLMSWIIAETMAAKFFAAGISMPTVKRKET